MKKRSFDSEVLDRVKSLSGVETGMLGELRFGYKTYPLIYLKAGRFTKGSRTIFLSGIVHGEEPAGGLATLDFFRYHLGRYDGLNFVGLPCVNPSGFEYDSRCNLAGMNINTSFGRGSRSEEVWMIDRFLGDLGISLAFAMDMHEDNIDVPMTGYSLEENVREFYLYEVSPSKRDSIGRKVITGLERTGVEVCQREKVYFEDIDKGLIWSRGVAEPGYVHADTLEGYCQNYTPHTFNTETPTCWDIKKRVDVHLQVLFSVLDDLHSII